MFTLFIFRFSRRLRISLICSILLVTFLSLSSLCQAQSSPPVDQGSPNFKARLINIEAASNEPFRYQASLHNNSEKQIIYDLKAELPNGWMISYNVEGSRVTSLNLDPGKTQDISIEINPSLTSKPDKYKIPIKAISERDTLTLALEAVVKGSYGLELTTPSGRLNDEVTSGSKKEIKLLVKNTGTLPLKELEFSEQLPTKWEVSFQPTKVEELEPGKSADITATLTVPDKTIAGDYAAKYTVKNANTESQISFRLIVTTSLISGWIGFVLILLAVGLVYYLIRKYGRR